MARDRLLKQEEDQRRENERKANMAMQTVDKTRQPVKQPVMPQKIIQPRVETEQNEEVVTDEQ